MSDDAVRDRAERLLEALRRQTAAGHPVSVVVAYAASQLRKALEAER